MSRRLSIALAVVLSLAASCGAGKSALFVVVDRTPGLPPIANIDHLHVTFEWHGETRELDFPSAPRSAFSIPPEQSFSVQFNAVVDGTVIVHAVAVDAQGVVLAAGDSIATIAPSESSTAGVMLGNAPADMAPAVDMPPGDLGVDGGSVDALDGGADITADLALHDLATSDFQMLDFAMPDLSVLKGSCSDGAKDADETDVDCGGSCKPCAAGMSCKVQHDCASMVCSNGACRPPTCNDGVQNGSETDVDCGGGGCPACVGGKACKVGTDCASGVCKSSICAVPTCGDGVKNGAETDVDCGGGVCPACNNGSTCGAHSDCVSGVCLQSQCMPPSCSDSITDGTETDVDCGGQSCPSCGSGKRCVLPTDCASHVCTSGQCTTPSCTDKVKNGTETDIDCGGPCPACAFGRACAGNTDCVSRNCGNGVCGLGWSTTSSGTTLPLWSVWAASASDLFVAASDSTNAAILHSTSGGVSWSTTQTGSRFQRVTGLDPSKIFVVEANGLSTFYESDNDGQSWGAKGSPGLKPLYDIWAASSSDTFFAQQTGGGGSPLILHLLGDGTTTSATIASTATPAMLWASSLADIYVVGSGGFVARSVDNGQSFQVIPTPTGGYLRGIWGSSASDVYVVGDNGVILHTTNHGQSWDKKAPVSASLHAIGGASASDVYAVGDAGTIVHSGDGGASWGPMMSSVTVNLYGLAVVSASQAVAVGDGGTIILAR